MKYLIFSLLILFVTSCSLSKSTVHFDDFKTMKINSVHVSYADFNNTNKKSLIDSIQFVLSQYDLEFNEKPIDADSSEYDLHLLYSLEWSENGHVLNRLEMLYINPLNNQIVASSKYIREGSRHPTIAYRDAMATIRNTFYQNDSLKALRALKATKSVEKETTSIGAYWIPISVISIFFLVIYPNFFVARLNGG